MSGLEPRGGTDSPNKDHAPVSHGKSGENVYHTGVVMRGLPLLLLLAASDAWGARDGMLLLVRPGFQAEETALMQGLRIYTQDLEIPFKTGSLTTRGTTLEEETAAAMSACAGGMDLVLWFGRDRGSPRLLALRCDSRELRETLLGETSDMELTAQTLALKVRWLLGNRSSKAGDEDWRPLPAQSLPTPTRPPLAGEGARGSSSPPMPVPAATPPRAATPTSAAQPQPRAEAEPPGKAEPVVPAADARASLNARPEAGGVEVTAAFGLDGGIGAGWVREFVGLRLALPFLRGRLAVALDGSVGTDDTALVGNRRATLRDYPLGLSLLPRMIRSRWMLGVGPRAALHLLAVNGASNDGRYGQKRTATLGLGALVEARLRLGQNLALGLAGTVDYLTARRQFTLDGEKAFDSGKVRWGAAVEISYALR